MRHLDLARGIAIAVAIASCGRLNFEPEVINDGANPDVPNTWWDVGWSHRIRITLHNTHAETLSDFTIRVHLDASRLPSGLAAADARDLRFVDADQQTQLPYEIESFDGVTGEIWVLVPSVPELADHVIWLYVGNAAATAPHRELEVWPPADYRLVMHMASLADSTAHANNAADTATTVGPGMIGSGRVFDYLAPSYLMIADSPSFHPLSSALTVSSWSTHTGQVTVNDRASVARSDAAATTGDNFFLGNAMGTLYVEVSTQLTDQVPFTAGAVVDNTWFHCALVVDGLVATTFLDGAPAMQRTLDSAIQDSNRPVTIGADIDASTIDIPNDDFVDGTIDEVRIEAVARSASWIAAQYESMVDTFASFAMIETR